MALRKRAELTVCRRIEKLFSQLLEQTFPVLLINFVKLKQILMEPYPILKELRKRLEK